MFPANKFPPRLGHDMVMAAKMVSRPAIVAEARAVKPDALLHSRPRQEVKEHRLPLRRQIPLKQDHVEVALHSGEKNS